LLLDIVLGWGCHEDPAGEAISAIGEAINEYGDGPITLAHVCGNPEDFQGYAEQLNKLQTAGVFVLETNAAVARISADMVSIIEGRK